jgi:bifunctional ADP-heptose synthase (sugar kinase/adenylyltransferase)
MNKILVVGDSCIDIFVYGDCYRLNPEAPTAVLSETYRVENPGMAANVLKNIQVLGLDADFLTHTEKITKLRYVDEKSNYILLRIDNENKVKRIENLFIIDFSQYELVVISDYNKGFLLEEDLKYIFKHSNLSFVDTKKPINRWMKNATFIKINEIEYNNPDNNFKIMTKDFKEKLIITFGKLGATYNGINFKPISEIMVRDVTGAGDTFLAALACHYYLNKNIEDAIKFANLCAGQVVSKKGIAYPNEKLS